MKKLGFKEFLDEQHDGYIITSYKFPEDENFDFSEFYNRLANAGENNNNAITVSNYRFTYIISDPHAVLKDCFKQRAFHVTHRPGHLSRKGAECRLLQNRKYRTHFC